jgi:signal transduction histidine kinase
MILQYSPFIIPLLLSAAITGTLALLSLKRRNDPVMLPFILMMSATTVWAGGYAVQLASADLPTNLLVTAILYPAIVTTPVTWLLVVLCFTGYNHVMCRRNAALLFVVPVLVLVLLYSNPVHHLYYTAFNPLTLAGAVVWEFVHGPLFWIQAAYGYFCILTGIFLIIRAYIAAPPIHRRQIALLALAVGIPLAANVIYVFGFNPFPGIDITPLAFTFMGSLMAVGIFRFRLFTLAPVAYPLVFTAIDDAVIVLDRNDFVCDLNPAARAIVRAGDRPPVGEPAAEVLPAALAEIPACDGPVTEALRHVAITKDNGSLRDYEVACRPIRTRVGGYAGRLLVLRDVTEQRKAHTAIERANRKLNLLSSVTRHDMQNKLTALGGYLGLAQAEKDPAVIRNHLAAMEKITRIFQDELEFTRDYQDLGVHAPVWQDVAVLVSAKTELLKGHGVRVAIDIRPAGLVIYTDLLLEKVFYNLIDNALRYGGEGMTEIRIASREENGSLVLVFADNGTGIPAEDKPRLFSKGFGKNTGLGLFLSQEILAITGIAIAEDGEPGKGARFVITVPEGMYRYPGSPAGRT